MKEIWKDIKGYENLYKISTKGRIMSMNYKGYGIKCLLKQCVGSAGYYVVSLCKDKSKRTFNAHQLMAIAFLDHEPNGYVKIVDHINNNPLDNRLENLQITTARINTSKDRTGSSKYTGVHFDKLKNNWRARISVEKKYVHIGNFETDKKAREAYLIALMNINSFDGCNKKFRSTIKSQIGIKKEI